MKLRLFLVVGVFLFLFVPAMAQPLPPSDGNGPALTEKLDIHVGPSGIFLKAENADLKHVFAELSRKTGVFLTAGPQIDDHISLEMNGVDLEEILKKICANRAIVFEYKPETNAYRILSGYGFDRAQTDTTQDIKTGKTDPFATPIPNPSSIKTVNSAGLPVHAHLTDKKMYDARGRLLYKPGELLVKLKKDILPADIHKLHATLGSRVIETIKSLRLQRIALKKDMDEDAAASLYLQSGLVDIAEKNALRYKNAEPDDPLFSEQWGMTVIQAPAAWDITTGSDTVVVAVIDTGVDYLHPDLADNIWTNTAELNGVADFDDDGNGFVDDIQGWDFAGDGENEDNDPLGDDSHGTHVAGIIAARGNNGIGVAGVCWNLKIMPVKIQADGAESMTTADILQGMEYAMENGARVINCSYGGPSFVDSEKDMLSLLGDQGILAVCAAGNDGSDIDENTNNYPAEYDLANILAVASNDKDGGLYTGSNYGVTSVDVMAPGVDIKSTVPFVAFIETNVGGVKNIFSAEGLTFARLTEDAGIKGSLYDCGLGKAPEDFPDGVTGNFALIERGDIYFSEKAANAMQAGATGAIIYDNVPGILNIFTLQTSGNWIPVISISQTDGEALKFMISDQPVVTLVSKFSPSSSNYSYMTGTSMATPHVTGLAGLLLSINPNLGYAGLKSIIMDTVDPVDGLVNKLVTDGRVNAYAAVTAARMGDFDCDGHVGLSDVIMVLKVISGADYIPCEEPSLAKIDPDGNGRIDLSDAVYLLQAISGNRY